ncbi:MAG TPA: hypothetical protein VFU23_02245 [Gemmatimonadales bacterium]|nr:hypothetical protein [Gemmatimonadales bacterium]
MHRNIAQAFDSIPEAKFGYKPTPAQLTIGYIAQHVASDSYLFCDQFGAKKSSLPAIGQLEDGRLGDQVTLSFGGRSRDVPRISMVLGHALDLADHYSQLANYMRLLGMLPPSALPRPKP